MEQERIADILAGYEVALRLEAGHDAARQALVDLLLEGKRGTDAERMLQEKLNSKPDHTGFTMMPARLQVEHGAVASGARRGCRGKRNTGKALPNGIEERGNRI